MTKQKRTEYALVNLLEWAKGNRGTKHGNPYGVLEVKLALITLAHLWDRDDYLDVDKAKEYTALNVVGRIT